MIHHIDVLGVVCPWCGHDWQPSTALLIEWDKHCIGYPEACRRCGKLYEIKYRTTRLFSTHKSEVKAPLQEAL